MGKTNTTQKTEYHKTSRGCYNHREVTKRNVWMWSSLLLIVSQTLSKSTITRTSHGTRYTNRGRVIEDQTHDGRDY